MQNKNDNIISKESSLLLFIRSLVYLSWEFGWEPRILPDSGTNALRHVDSDDNEKSTHEQHGDMSA